MQQFFKYFSFCHVNIANSNKLTEKGSITKTKETTLRLYDNDNVGDNRLMNYEL